MLRALLGDFLKLWHFRKQNYITSKFQRNFVIQTWKYREFYSLHCLKKLQNLFYYIWQNIDFFEWLKKKKKKKKSARRNISCIAVFLIRLSFKCFLNETNRLRRSQVINVEGTPINRVKSSPLKSVLKLFAENPMMFFASFYLKDIQFVFKKYRSLGPFVAAGELIS